MDRPRFESKDAARAWVWDALQDHGVARFPFPPHDRIPNFQGAREAAEALLGHELFQRAEAIKVNPDAPQRHLRELALLSGITVYVPTPRLRGGFKRLDPEGIPVDETAKAASLSHMDAWAEDVPLDDLPAMDAIVAGSVAVSPAGHRAGKGEGYSDLEYAILAELGHDPPPVATTVHDLQVVAALPWEATDLPLWVIVTPERVLEVETPPPPPTGIDWDLLPEERLAEMPVLGELRERRTG